MKDFRWQQWLSAPSFYRLTTPLLLPLAIVSLLLFLWVGVWGLFIAPPDAVQGQVYRIIFVHVPLSFICLSNYLFMAVHAFVLIIWRTRLAEDIMYACARLGVILSLLVLLTGSIWAKPTWGAWWVWDARLSSMLVLFFIYLAVLALREAYRGRAVAARICALLVLVGAIDVVIVHKAVDWWYSLHQGSSLSITRAPSIDASMLYPLLLAIACFYIYYILALLLWVRYELVQRSRGRAWLMDVVGTLK